MRIKKKCYTIDTRKSQQHNIAEISCQITDYIFYFNVYANPIPDTFSSGPVYCSYEVTIPSPFFSIIQNAPPLRPYLL